MIDMQRVLSRIEVVIVGAALAVAGGYFLKLEMGSPPVHAVHVYIFAGMIGLGCLVIIPAPIVSALQQLGAVLGPYLPWGKKGGGAA